MDNPWLRRDWSVLGMGWLVRPELVVSSCVFVAVVVALSGLSPRSAIRATVIALALRVTYQIFRMGYYGLLVSSPAIAKEGAAANRESGWNYFKDFTGPATFLVVPLFATAFGVAVPFVRRLLRAKLTRPAATVIVVSVSGLLNAGAVVVIGGDYVHARLLLPALFAFVAPFFVVAATIRNLEDAGWRGCLGHHGDLRLPPLSRGPRKRARQRPPRAAHLPGSRLPATRPGSAVDQRSRALRCASRRRRRRSDADRTHRPRRDRCRYVFARSRRLCPWT